MLNKLLGSAGEYVRLCELLWSPPKELHSEEFFVMKDRRNQLLRELVGMLGFRPGNTIYGICKALMRPVVKAPTDSRQ